MKFPQELLGDWNNLDKTKMPNVHKKFFDRNKTLKYHYAYLSKHLPEYLEYCEGKAAIDISSASGSVCEIFRHYGYDVHAVDLPVEKNFNYFEFLKSQNIPCTFHDCTEFPYPIDTDSYDIVTNFGAITFYKPFKEMWPKVMDEFARISRGCIFIAANRAPMNKDNVSILKDWENPDFKLVYTNDLNIFKWVNQ